MTIFAPNRRSTYIFFLANGLFYGCWAARIPVFADELDLSEARLAMLLFSMAAGAAISMTASPFLMRRFGSLNLARALGTGMAISFVMLAFAPSAIWLGMALFAMGACGGGMDIAMNAYGSKVERAAGTSLMSGFHGAWSVGTTLGGLTAFATLGLGIGTIPHFLGMFGLLAGLAILFDRAKPFHSTIAADAPLRALGRLGGIKAIRITCLIALLSFVSEGVIMDWGGLYFVDYLRANASQAALAVTFFSAAMMVARLIGDPVINAAGPRSVFIGSLMVAALGMGILLIATAPYLGYLGFAMMGAGLSVTVPIAFSTAPLYAKDYEEEAIAIVGMIAYLGLLTGPVFVGMIAEIFSLKLAFAIFGLFFVTAISAFPVFKPRFEAQT